MATTLTFWCFPEDLAHGKHDFSSHQLKVALTLSSPSVSNDSVYADLIELANGGGYTVGGAGLALSSSGQVEGNYKLTVSDAVWTGVGAGFSFRYAVVYNDTSTTKPLIGFVDYGTVQDVAAAEPFTFDVSNLGGLIVGT